MRSHGVIATTDKLFGFSSTQSFFNTFDLSYVDSIITSRIHTVGWEIDGPLLNLKVVIAFFSA
jgi:hypothetical protein